MQRAGVGVTVKFPAWQSRFYHPEDVTSRAVAAPLRSDGHVHHMEFNRHGVMIRDWWTAGEDLPEATRARLREAAGSNVWTTADGELLEI